ALTDLELKLQSLLGLVYCEPTALKGQMNSFDCFIEEVFHIVVGYLLEELRVRVLYLMVNLDKYHTTIKTIRLVGYLRHMVSVDYNRRARYHFDNRGVYLSYANRL